MDTGSRQKPSGNMPQEMTNELRQARDILNGAGTGTRPPITKQAKMRRIPGVLITEKYFSAQAEQAEPRQCAESLGAEATTLISTIRMSTQFTTE